MITKANNDFSARPMAAPDSDKAWDLSWSKNPSKEGLP
jgi:hypothetical protein